MSEDVQDVEDEDLYRALWEAGELSFLLAPEQEWAYNAFWNLPKSAKVMYLHWSRRLGKDHLCTLLACEVAIRFPGSRLLYTHPVAKTGGEILLDTMENFILPTCPKELRPKGLHNGHLWVWKNGSRMYMQGLSTLGDINNARGRRAGVWFCTEAGFVSYLDKAKDAILPVMMKQAGPGRAVFQSNAADDADHEFFLGFDEAKADGAAQEQTIHASTRYSEEEIEAFRRQYRTRPDKWRREWECAREVDADLNICPGFGPRTAPWWTKEEIPPETPGGIPTVVITPAREGDPCAQRSLIEEREPPLYCNTFTAVDIGFSPDHSYVITGWYDWDDAVLYFADCRDMLEADNDELAAAVKSCEKIHAERWAKLKQLHPREPELRKHNRYMDVDPKTRKEMGTRKLTFATINNKEPEAMNNVLNTYIHQSRLRVHPRAENLIAQLRSGRWNQTRTKYAHSPKYGHWDGCAAAAIAASNVVTRWNPYPAVALEWRGGGFIDPAVDLGLVNAEDSIRFGW